jgi:hypothetical protein
VGQAFNMYTFPSLSKTSASKIILQSGQMLCVYLIVLLSAVFLLERFEICISSISITYVLASLPMSANFVYKHNLTTPTVISLLQLEAGERYVFISIYRYKLGYNLLIHYLSILVCSYSGGKRVRQ